MKNCFNIPNILTSRTSLIIQENLNVPEKFHHPEGAICAWLGFQKGLLEQIAESYAETVREFSKRMHRDPRHAIFDELVSFDRKVIP